MSESQTRNVIVLAGMLRFNDLSRRNSKRFMIFLIITKPVLLIWNIKIKCLVTDITILCLRPNSIDQLNWLISNCGIIVNCGSEHDLPFQIMICMRTVAHFAY